MSALDRPVDDEVSRDTLSSPSRRWTRIAIGVVEGLIVVLVVVLLLALVRQILAVGYLVMGRDDYYLDVSRQVLAGLVPYRDFPFEYPPLALLPMVLPALVQLDGQLDRGIYAVVLALENAIFVALTAACLAWLAGRGWSAHRARTTVLVYVGLVVATPILFWRFDAFPALLAVVAVVAFVARRFATAGFALALGTLAKLYPVVLTPLMLGERAVRGDRRGISLILLGLMAPIAIGLVVAFVAAGGSELSFLGYHVTRGVQLESVPASVALVAHLALGAPANTFLGFGSWQLESPVVEQLAWLWPTLAVAMVVALVVSALVSYRYDAAEIGEVRAQTQLAHFAAAIVVLMLSYRVLSPQYLVWLLPFAALMTRHRIMLVLAICALTLYLVPFGYEALVNLEPGAIFALALRNGLLIALFVWLVAPGLSIAVRSLRATLIQPPARA